MNAIELEAAAAALPSYEVWQEKSEALRRAAEIKPEDSTIRIGNTIPVVESQVKQLQAQIEYLRAAEEINLPEAQDRLRVDIAQAADSIPLPHRLGMLTVIDNPLAPQSLSDYKKDDIKDALEAPELPEIKLPPHNQFERAAQIGALITEVSVAITSDESVPLVEMSLSRDAKTGAFSYRLDDLYLTKGIQERSLGREPDITEAEDGRAAEVLYSLPKLSCLPAYCPERDGKFAAKVTDSPLHRKFIKIPQLEILKTGHIPSYLVHIRKLVFGEEAVTLVEDYFSSRSRVT